MTMRGKVPTLKKRKRKDFKEIRMDNDALKSRKDRGKSSEDESLFGSLKQLDRLQKGLEDMYYLLSRDYPARSSLALVGNRYRLKTRQLLALQGMAASEKDLIIRKKKELKSDELKGQTLYLDGFNILILLESLLSGAFIFKGIDECYRDISSVHGTYRKVNQTEEVLILVSETLQQLGLEKVIWIFDTPVSNSGKLKVLCYEIAEQYNFSWDIYLDNSPDKFLVQDNRLMSSSDAWILNECAAWFNLISFIINKIYPENKPATIIETTTLYLPQH